MTSVFAIVRRILTQFALDKRTLALLFVAPLVVLWLLSVILGADTVGPKIATVDLPAEFQAQLEQTDARITETDADEASALLADNDVAAVLSMEGEHTLKVELEGTDSRSRQQCSPSAPKPWASCAETRPKRWKRPSPTNEQK